VQLRVGRFVACLALISLPLRGDDVWLVRTNADGGVVEPPCGGLLWGDDIVFHNSSQDVKTIHFVGLSNGEALAPLDLVLAPGTTVGGLRSQREEVGSWTPFPRQSLWSIHLDVPSGVDVVSRLISRISGANSCGFPSTSPDYAGVSLPVIRALSPAGTTQTHLGSDLGDTARLQGARINVGVYNAGTVTANVTVEIRRGCDDGLVAKRTFRVPPNSVEQTNGLPAFSDYEACTTLNTSEFVTYAVVLVDQPSFSYVAVLANGSVPRPPITVAPD
jgi:hypothetical protein